MNSNKPVRHVVVVGAGLVGSVMAIYLARRNYQVTLLERRPDPRTASQDHGRSINLALSNRGWKPLEEIDVAEEVKKIVIPMRGRMMHDVSGELTFQPYGMEGQAINSVSRGGLNCLLLNKAEQGGVNIRFDTAVRDVNFSTTQLLLEDQGPLTADLIIGADGAFSVLRSEMQRAGRFNYSQYFIDYGYKELTIPAGPAGNHLIEKNALHIWPRGKYMLIALPNLDGSYTCTLFLPFEGHESFEKLEANEHITAFFEKKFPDTTGLLSRLQQDFSENPTSSLVTIRCFPWARQRVLLIGDASHAIVPFYGQGMNSGFEDCRILNLLLDEYHDDWESVLPQFQAQRKPDADAIADLALANFIEMRDLVADDLFLLRKKIEARLQKTYPERWIPLYSMVTFREDLRYSEALKRGKDQKEIMDEVMQLPDIQQQWEQLPLEPLIAKLEKRRTSYAN